MFSDSLQAEGDDFVSWQAGDVVSCLLDTHQRS